MLTPASIYNRPGLSVIAYRVGTHGQFKRSMLAALTDSRNPPLANLTTRDDDDFSITLLDSAAVVADVLSFYQERIANECYVRTATETTSLNDLALLVGYSPRPGVAANTYLAFTLEDPAGNPRKVTLDVGVKVQSIPGAGESPQTFETIEAIEARSEWNSLTAKTSETQEFDSQTTELYLDGVDTNLDPGDAILLVSDDRLNYTKDQHSQTALHPFANGRANYKSGQGPANLLHRVASDQGTHTTVQDDQSLAKWDIRILQNVEQVVATDPKRSYTRVTWERPLDVSLIDLSAGEEIHVFALRQRAALFGHNAPNPKLLNTTGTQLGDLISHGEWKGFEFDPKNPPTTIELDSVYKKIVGGSWMVLLKRHHPSRAGSVHEYGELYHVKEVSNPSLSKFALTAKISHIVPDIVDRLAHFGRRETIVFAQSEELKRANKPLSAPITGPSVTLSGAVVDLGEGRLIVAQGNDAMTGDPIQEVTELAGVDTKNSQTTLTFDPPLSKSYELKSFSINANVARATHGETVKELLGNGDNSRPFQRFVLRQPPLTYVTSGTATGVESTLRVYVNDLEWHESAMLFGHSGLEHVFSTQTDSNSRTSLQFGNGDLGSRLPTGQFNLSATYRKGIGLQGQVRKSQLSTLLTRPLGVKAVTNPLDSTGAQDPETQSEIKKNIPLRVMTLDRAVSLQDYEDFARSFGGIAKALAARTWDGRTLEVFLTVAGPKGASIEPTDPVYQNLAKALQDYGDPLASVRIQSFEKVLFRLAGKVQVDPDFLLDKVTDSVSTALRSRFSFDAREFGQPVALSEVIETIQDTPGVVGVTIDTLYIQKQNQILNSLLPAHLPQPNKIGTMVAAELLILDPDPTSLGQLVITH